MAPLGFFYGLQPCWWSADGLYKVYVSTEMLAGAYIAGQFYDEDVAALQLQQATLFFAPLIRRWLKRRSEREAHYSSADPFSAEFLECDRRNFHIQRTNVLYIRLLRRRALWTPFNAGSVEVKLVDGPARRLILVNDQNADEILGLLKAFYPLTEAIGKPAWWQCSVARFISDGQMVTEFCSRKHRYRFDGDGLQESNHNGEIVTLIPWSHIDKVKGSTIRQTSGQAIRIRLAPAWQRSFAREFSSAWRTHCPDAWRGNRLRALRELRRWFWLWLPLLFLSPVCLLYLVNWLPRGQAQPDPAMYRLAVFTGGLAVLSWLFDLCYLRGQAERIDQVNCPD
jgi:hypothetical protein